MHRNTTIHFFGSRMLEKFKQHDISFEKIIVHIGPGLGKESYSIGQQPYEDLKKIFGDVLDQAVTTLFTTTLLAMTNLA